MPFIFLNSAQISRLRWSAAVTLHLPDLRTHMISSRLIPLSANSLRMTTGSGSDQYLLPFFRGLQHDAHGRLYRAGVADLYGNDQTQPVVRIGLTDNRRSNKSVVRNKRFSSVFGLEHHISRSKRNNLSLAVVHRHRITDVQGSVQQNDVSTDVVTRNLLQAESEPYPKCAPEHGQNGNIYPTMGSAIKTPATIRIERLIFERMTR